jgi:hypothetical protein
MTKLLPVTAIVLSLFTLSACVVAPAPPAAYAYGPGYAYAPAPVVVGVGGGCWRCGGWGWRHW